MSDDVEWRSCLYGDPLMDKEATLTYMKGWQDAMEDITYTPENYLPGVDPETGQLNGSVRTYGTWTGTNTESGKVLRYTCITILRLMTKVKLLILVILEMQQECF